jgi:hypothetical protein
VIIREKKNFFEKKKKIWNIPEKKKGPKFHFLGIFPEIPLFRCFQIPEKKKLFQWNSGMEFHFLVTTIF